MHPILFRIPLPGWNLPLFGSFGSLPIYSYGVMLGLSLVVGWYLTLGLAERDGLPPEAMANCYVITALCALVGARILYLVTDPTGAASWTDWFALRQGGLVAYGGFIGGFLGSWLYLRRKSLSLLPWADVAVPSLATGLFLTRIGCYLFGCDYGKRLALSAPLFLKRLGTFPRWPEGSLAAGAGSPAWLDHVQRALVAPDALASLPVHPTQLYESLLGLALLGLVWWQRRQRVFVGQVFLLFTFTYGFARYLLEMLRDDAERGEFGPFLPEHVLVPGGLAVLGMSYGWGIARGLRRPWMRETSRALALLPAALTYLALRPATFVDQTLVKLSTSQCIALVTGSVAAWFYRRLWSAPPQATPVSLPSGTEAVV